MTFNRETSKDQKFEKPIDKAMQIFENWAESNNRNYFGDLVRENLGDYLNSGYSPQEAVDALITKVRYLGLKRSR